MGARPKKVSSPRIMVDAKPFLSWLEEYKDKIYYEYARRANDLLAKNPELIDITVVDTWAVKLDQPEMLYILYGDHE